MSTTKDNEHLYTEYPDLLGENGNPDPEPNLLRLVRDLDVACAPSQPPAHLSASIAQTIAEHTAQAARPLVSSQAHLGTGPQRRSKWLPVTRLGWAAVLLVAFLTLSAGVYAVLPPLGQAFHIAGIDQIEQSNLGRQVDYRQTINGYTVVVKRVYADANRIIIGYIISQSSAAGGGSNNSASSNVQSVSEKLTGDGGATFQAMVGAGSGSGIQGGEAGYVLTYDAAAPGDVGDSAAVPRTLNLHFTMDLVAFRQANQATPAPTGVQTGPNSWAVEAQRVWQEKVAGPFTFNFSVPVIQGRVADVHQTAQASGVGVTLERVVVTPAETRFYLRYASPNGRTDLEWNPMTSLQVNGQTRGGGAILGGKRLSSDTWFSSILAPLYNEQGQWTLTVSELVGMRDLNGMQFNNTGEMQEALKQERFPGPWTFNFTLPPAPNSGK